MVRRSVADDSNGGVTLAGSIELREVDALPLAEYELGIAHRDRHIVAGQHRFDVRVRISLRVAELFLTRHELSEMREQIALHIRVGVLVHEDPRGRVRARDDADPVADLRARDRRTDARRDVGGRDRLLGRDRESFVVDGHARPAFSAHMRTPTILPAMRTWGEARAAAIARLGAGADPST